MIRSEREIVGQRKIKSDAIDDKKKVPSLRETGFRSPGRTKSPALAYRSLPVFRSPSSNKSPRIYLRHISRKAVVDRFGRRREWNVANINDGVSLA